MKLRKMVHMLMVLMVTLGLMGCGGSPAAAAPKEEESVQSKADADPAPQDAEAGGITEEKEEAPAEEETAKEQTPELQAEKKTFSSRQIQNACIYHRLASRDLWYPLGAEIEAGAEEDDIYGDTENRLEVRLFGLSDYKESDVDRYTIDTMTWTGTDAAGEEVDLNEALASICCDEDLQTLMTAAGCLFSSYFNGIPQELSITEEGLSEAHMDTYALHAFYRIGTRTPVSETEMTDNYYYASGEEVYDLFRSTLGADAEKYLEKAVLQGSAYAETVFAKEEDRYKIMGLTLTDPMYFFRPLSEEAGQAEQERCITAELVYMGNTIARSMGLYKIDLSPDPESAYGWVLSGVTAAEPEFIVESISASTTLDGYPAENMLDHDLTTTWAEGEGGLGRESTITLRAAGPARVHGIRFGSGFLKSVSLLEENARPISYTIILDGKTTIVGGAGWPDAITPLHLEDPYSSESIIDGTDYQGYSYTDSVSFGKEFIASEIVIRIQEIMPGTRYDDTCISEIYVY